jgi:hypothetical protein
VETPANCIDAASLSNEEDGNNAGSDKFLIDVSKPGAGFGKLADGPEMTESVMMFLLVLLLANEGVQLSSISCPPDKACALIFSFEFPPSIPDEYPVVGVWGKSGVVDESSFLTTTSDVNSPDKPGGADSNLSLLLSTPVFGSNSSDKFVVLLVDGVKITAAVLVEVVALVALVSFEDALELVATISPPLVDSLLP